MADWVILGAGNLIGDLVDAIQANGDQILTVVFNQDLPPSLVYKIGSMGIPLTSCKSYLPNNKTLHIFGFLNPNKELFLQELEKHHLQFGNLIHPRAYLPTSTKLGVGNYIGPNVTLGSFVSLKDFNFLNRASSIGHDTTIGSFTHVGPAATVCGNCRIGNKVYVGAGATSIDGLQIKDQVTLGAGAVATKNLSEPGIYVGIPARHKII